MEDEVARQLCYTTAQRNVREKTDFSKDDLNGEKHLHAPQSTHCDIMEGGRVRHLIFGTKTVFPWLVTTA